MLAIWLKNIKDRLLLSLLAVLLGLFVGSLFILAAGANPLEAYLALFRAGFGCRGTGGFCALFTALQYATPLILSGLSALVAFHAGVFSIGQAGQMVLGAGYATMVATSLDWPPGLLVTASLMAGITAGAAYGLVPGYLKVKLGISEIIVTIILNSVAGVFVGRVGFMRIPENAQIPPLIHGTKLNGGLLIAIFSSILIFFYLYRFAGGYEQRMAGRAGLFARFGGIKSELSVIRAMLISGGLAGLAGAIETLGVQYRFVTQFSAIDAFDGIIVALISQLHPIGVLPGALFLGGIRLGALNGLQLQASVPRELGTALIALFVLFVSAPGLFLRFIRDRKEVLPAQIRAPEIN